MNEYHGSGNQQRDLSHDAHERPHHEQTSNGVRDVVSEVVPSLCSHAHGLTHDSLAMHGAQAEGSSTHSWTLDGSATLADADPANGQHERDRENLKSEGGLSQVYVRNPGDGLAGSCQPKQDDEQEVALEEEGEEK